MNYYNEFDPFAAEWLRKLIKAGLIPNGHVDDRSILEVTPNDLKGFTQHHFFAGIAGWAEALRLAGWGADRPIWTASLPCQPFSVAGAGLGKDDERHLLPHFMSLVRECRPDTIIGEQVEGAVRHGWLDDLYTEMEAESYAVGAAVLGAHSVGAPHQRQRLYWVADSISERWGGRDVRCDKSDKRRTESKDEATRSCDTSTVANTNDSRQQGSWELRRPCDTAQNKDREVDRVVDASWFNHWGKSTTVYCRDGKYRPIPQSGLQPMVNGIPDGLDALWLKSLEAYPLIEKGLPNRAGILKGAGNAIVPQTAAEFIKATMGVLG